MEEEKEEARQYTLSLWWVENRARLKTIGLVSFGVVDGLLLLFALWTFTDSFLVSYGRERDAVVAMATRGQDDLYAFSRGTAGNPIAFTGTTVIAEGDGRYDFYTLATNPNGDWYGEFDYFFRSSAGETPRQRGFILPGEEKPLLALAVVAAAAPQRADAVIENMAWRRVDKHLTGDFSRWSADRLRLPVSDVAFSSDLMVDSKTIGRVTFTVKNDTAYGYYDPAFVILLKRGTTVVGANRTTLSSLPSGVSQEVAVNWFGPIPSASQTEVIPEINIFDPSIYMPAAQ
ncbi:hypothetical protein A2856_03095 [Candidatus Uhrbacteria bacterium RIFCSPHIGHO2_01_FULL_63_20]|uniref:Uncharacterized protein n=1 Tax=Candidatus Uhrbacteria bacterium RIFCSPHIGHO2_01_FULL_63_20 TaxID=1802385 RepID=A0A1F7TL60_9BACT|nr:MAG: hypothetical protein A2856_03095 [Candidatus Uhrbacteria bacterium RIFCSPHIGHO2_01_FULL_63_20]